MNNIGGLIKKKKYLTALYSAVRTSYFKALNQFRNKSGNPIYFHTLGLNCFVCFMHLAFPLNLFV